MGLITATSPIDEVRIKQIGGGAVTIPAATILGFRHRIRQLEDALRELKDLSEAHHADQEPHVWLHGLTVDIPHRIDNALRGYPQ